MTFHRKTRPLVLVILLAFAAACSRGPVVDREGPPRQSQKETVKEVAAPSPIDPRTVAAFKAIGGEYGGFLKGGRYFEIGAGYAAQGIPGFQFSTMPTGKLPDVVVPFGLSMTYTTGATDEFLKEVAQHKNLAALSLGGTQVTDASLKELADLKGLTYLNLTNCNITGVGLKDLAPLRNLTTLYIESSPLQKLQVLKLSTTPITDTGLKELTPLKDLTHLYLYKTGVTDKGLKDLKHFRKLTVLDLAYSFISSFGLRELEDLENLTASSLSKDTLRFTKPLVHNGLQHSLMAVERLDAVRS
jgi:hypothetical protein